MPKITTGVTKAIVSKKLSYLINVNITWVIFAVAQRPLPKNSTFLDDLNFVTSAIKGTVMQIWKFHCMCGFIRKQYLESFAFLILRILELLTLKVCFFLKSRLLFNIFYCFCMFINKHFIYLGSVYLKK